MSNARTHLTTAVLVGLCAAAGGYLFVTRDSVTTGEQAERRSNLFKVFRRDALTRIAITRDGESYTLDRDAVRKDAGEIDTWKITRDKRAETADESLVDGLLSSLELAFPERRIKKEEVDRARFGLETPRLVVTLTMGGLGSTLKLGGPAPKPEGSVYADVDGEVVVVKTSRLAAIDRPAAAYASRRLSPYLSTELARLVLTPGGTQPERTLVRQKDGKYRLDERLLDRFGFDKALAAFADLTLTESLSDDAAKKAQAGAALVKVRLEPVPADGKPRAPATLLLGGPCPSTTHAEDVVARREGDEPTAGCVAKGAAEALGEGLGPELRAFTFREDEVEEVSLVRGQTKLEIARKDKGFHQRVPVDRDLSLDEARAFVKALVSAKAEAILPAAADVPELASPAGEVKLTGVPLPDADPGGERVVVGTPRKDGKVPVKRDVDGAVLLFSREQADAFLPRATSLRPHKILDRKPEEVRRVVVKGAAEDGAIEQVLVRSPEGAWSLEVPKGFPLDATAATDIAEAVARLTAERWVADTAAGDEGFEKPILTLETTFAGAGPENTLKVAFARQVVGGYLARRDGDPAVFVGSKALFATLTTWAIDRSVFQVDDTDAARVVLTGKGASPTRTFAFESGALVAKEGASPRDGERIREALGGLRAEAALHLGPARPAEGLTKPRLAIAVKGKPGKPDLRLLIGAADSYRGTAIFYARRDDLAATFVLPAARVRPLLDDE